MQAFDTCGIGNGQLMPEIAPHDALMQYTWRRGRVRRTRSNLMARRYRAMQAHGTIAIRGGE